MSPAKVILLILFISLPAISYSGTNGQILKAFFRSDCPPCLQEMQIIPDIARAHADLTIEVITLDNKLPQSDFPSNVSVVTGGDKEIEMVTDSGNRQFALPFSMFLRADGSVCGEHFGIVGTRLVNTWIKQC